MKKFISTIIALAMVLSMLPMTIASAAEPTDIAYWETKIADMEVENIAAGKTLVASDDHKELIKDGSKGVDSKVQNSAGSMAIYMRTDLVFARLDLGKVDDIQGIGLYRMDHDYPALPEVTFYGSNEELTARADLETKATLLGTIAEDTTAGDTTTKTTRSSGALAAPANSNYRYIYMTTTTCGTHINELYVYSNIEYPMDEFMTGLVGVDETDAQVTVFTDGTTTASKHLGGLVKYDLGAECDLKWLSFSANSLYSTYWHQNEMYIKANTTDDYDTATQIMSTGWENISQGRKVHINGTYRYIWVYGGNNTHFSRLRVYGYPTTAAQKTIEFENYIDKFAAAYGVTPVTSSSYQVSNKDHADFVADGNVILHSRTDGVIYSGNKAVYIKRVAATESKTIEIPVKITGDGWYSADAQLGGGSYNTISNVDMTLVDANGKETRILDRDYQNSEVADWANMRRTIASHGAYTYGYSGQTNYITKGDYTLKVKIDPYVTKNAAGEVTFSGGMINLDYLKLIPVTPTTVAADKTTTIEMESLDVQYGNDKYTNASGGKTLYSTYGSAKSGKDNIYNILVNVTKAGRYDISTVMNKRLSADYSTVSVAVNGNKIYDNTVDGEVQSDMQGGYINSSGNLVDNYAVHKYTNVVQLPAGENVITMTVESKYNIHRFMADCITIERSTTPAETVIEFEDYADSITADIAPEGTVATDRTYDVWSTSALTNGQFGRYIGTGTSGHLSDSTYVARLADGIPADPGYVEFDIPVDIYVGGYYQTTMNIGGGGSLSTSSEYAVELVDSNAKATPIIYTEGTPEGTGATRSVYSPYSGVMLTKVEGPVTYLNEGEYTLKFRLYGYKSTDSTKNDLLFCGDWLKITPATPYKLTDGELKVEWENVETANSYKSTTKDGTVTLTVEGKASNDGVIYNDWGSTTEHTTVVNNFLVEAAEAGEYSVESVMAKYTGGRSLLTLKVNGETVYTNQGDGIDVSDTDGDGTADFLNSGYSMRKYIGKAQLNEGINEVALEIQAYATDKRVKYAADYVSFAPYVENPISQSVATRIEMEDYADEFAAAYGETDYESLLETEHDYKYTNLRTKPVAMVRFDDSGKNFSNNKAMFGVKETDEPKVVQIPVTIKDAGYYNAKYRVGGTGDINTFAWFDTELIAEDGTAYSLSEAIYRESEDEYSNVTQTRINDGNGSYTWQLTSSPAYVPAGSYTMKMTITGTTFLCDYIDIMPVAAVDATEGLDFDVMKVKAHAAEGIANGGSIEYSDWSYTDKEVETYTYPITVPEDGYYDVEAVMHRYDGPSTSNIKLMIDDTVVYNNTNTGADLSVNNEEGTIDYLTSYFRVNKYTGNKVYLEAGAHELKVQTTKTSQDFRFVHKFAIDYAKLTKSNDTITIADGKVTITATYDSSVVADAYMAFYKDGKLIKVEKAGGVEEGVGNARTDEPTEEYDYVKLLAWGKECAPQAIAIGFAQ